MGRTVLTHALRLMWYISARQEGFIVGHTLVNNHCEGSYVKKELLKATTKNLHSLSYEMTYKLSTIAVGRDERVQNITTLAYHYCFPNFLYSLTDFILYTLVGFGDFIPHLPTRHNRSGLAMSVTVSLGSCILPMHFPHVQTRGAWFPFYTNTYSRFHSLSYFHLICKSININIFLIEKNRVFFNRLFIYVTLELYFR